MVTLNTARPPGADALCVLDVEPGSSSYGQIVGRVEMPHVGDELHHFGWNACSSALCPTRRTRTSSGATCWCPGCARRASTSWTPSPIRASRELVKTIEAGGGDAQEPATAGRTPSTAARTASTSMRSAPRTATVRAASSCWTTRPSRSGPLGERARAAVPGLRLLVAPRPGRDDHQRVGHAEHGRGRREPGAAAGRQVRPPAAHLGSAQAHATCRRWTSARSSRWCSSCGPSHDPNKTYGFVGVVRVAQGPVGVDLAVVPRERQVGRCARSSRFRPSRPIRSCCRRCCKPFGAVPPLITDINLSLDDRFLYVSCWGTGELPPVRRDATRSIRS